MTGDPIHDLPYPLPGHPETLANLGEGSNFSLCADAHAHGDEVDVTWLLVERGPVRRNEEILELVLDGPVDHQPVSFRCAGFKLAVPASRLISSWARWPPLSPSSESNG